MSDPITLERFRDLADAYGGVIARWPEQWREAAAGLARQPAAAAILAEAFALDEELNAWTVPAMPTPLRERVVAGLPVPRRSLAGRARLWWSGIGIAAAVAGAASGLTAVALLAPIDASAGGSTSFGDIAAQES